MKNETTFKNEKSNKNIGISKMKNQKWRGDPWDFSKMKNEKIKKSIIETFKNSMIEEYQRSIIEGKCSSMIHF